MLEYKEVFNIENASIKAPVDPTGVMISTIWSLRYCKGKSGCLGVLASSGEFKVFETKHEYSLSLNPNEPRSRPEFAVPSKDDRSILTKRVHHVELAWDDKRKGRAEKERVVAFDFTNLAGSRGTPCAIVLRGDHSVGVLELNGAAPALAVSPFGKIVVSKSSSSDASSTSTPEVSFLRNTVRKLEPTEGNGNHISSITTRGEHGDSNVDKATDAEKPQSSRESHELLLDSYTTDTEFQIEEALASFTIARRRGVEGYLFDCARNVEILRDDRWLQRLWVWIDRTYAVHRNERPLI